MTDKRHIITISGDLGSGKSTVSRILAERLGYMRYSTGDLQRDLARKRGLTSLELNKLSEADPSVDAAIDGSVVELAAKDDRLIIDSRLAWHFVPASFKVYLTVEPHVASTRIYRASRGDVERYASAEEALAKLSARRESEKLRFRTFYDLDLEQTDNYDLVVDSTKASPDQVTAKILDAFEAWLAK